MGYELPAKLKNLVPYAPVSGNFRIRLDANESFLQIPDALKEEILCRIKELEFNRYPDPCCSALCKGFSRFFDVSPDFVTAGNGSDELIGLISSAFLEYGDTMAVVSPDFSMYSFYAQLSGTTVAVYQKDTPSLDWDADSLAAFVKEKGAKLLMLSNPCNPTSTVAAYEEILRLISKLPDCLLVIDEAYMDFSEGSVLREAASFDNVIVLKTCSKAFGMAAIRLGFAVAAAPITQALRAVKSPYNVNSMTQAIGCVLFEHPDYLQSCILRIKESRDSLYQLLLALSKKKQRILQVVDTHANFVFLHVIDARKVFDTLAAEGIAVRLMGKYLRISAGSSVENREVIRVLEEIL